MHALKIINNASLELSRDKFISFVASFQSRGDKKITLVFDGRSSEYQTEITENVNDYLKIIYSKNNTNADGVIIKLVQITKISARKYVNVVTEDGPLKYTILALGSVVISPKSFLDEYNAYESTKPQKFSTNNGKWFNNPFNEL